MTINVRDPVDENATVQYAGPSQLVTADDSKNKFQVDYTGHFYSATVVPDNSPRYVPSVVVRPYGLPNPWTDETGVKHVLLRANQGEPGHAVIELGSGKATYPQHVTLVGNPPPPADRWQAPKVGMYKASRGRCVVTVNNTRARTDGALFVTDLRFDRKVRTKYKKVRNVLGRQYKAKASSVFKTETVVRIYWSKSQIKKTPIVRLRLTEHVFPAKSVPVQFVGRWSLNLSSCRR